MAVFSYKAVGADGKILRGNMEAPDAHAVISQLRAAGHVPINAEPRSPRPELTGLGERLSFWRKRVRFRDVTVMMQELATLLTAGMPIDAALRLLECHAEGSLKKVLKRIHADVQSGKTFSSALAVHEEIVDSLAVSLIRAGETSGALDVVMRRLAAYREQVEAARSQLASAITYPLILVFVSVVSLFSLMTFVVPRFMSLFNDAGETLPVLTRAVFFFAEQLQRFWWFLPFLLVLAIFLYQRWFEVPRNRKRLHAWVLRAPLVGPIVLLAETARFARTLATLIRNGLPLLGALKLAKGVLRNAVLAESVEDCIGSVRSGGRLAGALRRQAYFPGLAVDLIAVGEESGQLEDMLDKAADAFEARVQQRLKRFLTLVEPVLILGLGALIAVVIVAILLAMLGLNDLVI